MNKKEEETLSCWYRYARPVQSARSDINGPEWLRKAIPLPGNEAVLGDKDESDEATQHGEKSIHAKLRPPSCHDTAAVQYQ